jgi:hypothetical protein
MCEKRIWGFDAAVQNRRRLCYIAWMSNVEDIEKAIESLAPAELSKFRAWYEAFEAARFDDQIASDATSGKLDGLAEQALVSFRQGNAHEL